MLLSISLILIVGMSMGWICRKCKLPSLIGMLVTGIVLGPYVLDMLDESIISISPELRKIALIIILTRAGLGLDLSGLKKIGRPALLMCFLPATFELIGMIALAPRLMGMSLLEAAVMGAVLAAVSPAVVVPRMVKLIDEGYGVNEGIPQLILAGASVDDVYVIVLFSTFVGMLQGEGASVISFVNIPVSIVLGIAIGFLFGAALALYFKKVHIRDTSKVLIILSISLLLVVIEDSLKTPITFSALIAIMFIGIGFREKREEVAKRISAKYGKLWVAAEVFLFVLVGATVNINYLGKVGVKAIIVIIGALVCRMLGVFVCMLGTSIKGKERLFAMLAYTPKATVQAAIGGIPLALGLACGETVLTVAVLAIVITAPLGAFAIDLSYKKLLKKNNKKFEAVVFDMDGVIFDSERGVMLCWGELAEKYGIKDIEKNVLACTGTTMARTREIMLEAYGEDFPYDEYAKEASRMFHERYDGGRLPMKPGVVELLEYLKKQGKKIALASSTRRQTVVNELSDAHIIDYFDAIICGDMVERSKPAPDIFLKACEELGVEPESAYAIEDSYNGIRAAYNGGLMPIMVPDLLPANDEMYEKAVCVKENLIEVIDYMNA